MREHDPMAEVFALAVAVWCGADIRTQEQRARDEANAYQREGMQDPPESWFARWRVRRALRRLARQRTQE